MGAVLPESRIDGLKRIKYALCCVALGMVFVMASSHVAKAACSSPSGSGGEILYNSDSNVPQYCDGTDWVAMTGGNPQTPTGCPNIGDECSDGTVYAGLSPDGLARMYTTHCDAGMSWNGTSCSGSRLRVSWDDGDANRNVAVSAAQNNITGYANTQIIVTTDMDSALPGFQLSPAVSYCHSMTAGGHGDWYMPAVNELLVLYNNNAAIGNFNTSTWWYWSSTDNGVFNAMMVFFNDGSVSGLPKSSHGRYQRCVRKDKLSALEVSSGLIGYWRLDETSGTVAKDSSATGNNGTYFTDSNPATDSVSGTVGKAMSFADPLHNLSKRIDVPSNAAYVAAKDMTISFWVKPDEFFDFMGLASSMNMLRVYFGFSEKKLFVSVPAWGTGGIAQIYDNGFFNADEWAHVTVTYSYNDPVGTLPKIYINGTEITGGGNISWATTPSGSYVAPASSAVEIGSLNFGGEQTLQGALDDVRLYNRVLTAAEVQEIYHARDGINYNQTAHAPEYFNGNQWVAMIPPWPDVTNGLVGHWKLDETSGTTAADSSGNGNDGTLQNGMDAANDSSSGAVGTSLAFDGIDDNIAIANESNFDFERTDPFSISVWINRTSNADEDDIIEKVDISGYRGYGLWMDVGANEVTVSLTNNAGSNQINMETSGANITPQEWHHVLMTYDGSSSASGVTVYVDGVAATLNTYLDNLTATMLNNNPVLIGTDFDSGGCCEFNGKIDDVRIYDRALSAAEIQELYNMGRQLGSSTALPQGCPNIGDVCDDGTIYAGTSPDGNVPMFTTHDTPASLPWSQSSIVTAVQTSVTDPDTGAANTNTIVTIDADSGTVGFQPHQVAQYCYDLVEGGADDWYLPAMNETAELYNNRLGIGGFSEDSNFGLSTYWVSHEAGAATSARYIYFYDGSAGVTNKTQIRPFRCVRKGPAPRCANPYGIEGAMLYNNDHNVVQYCDGARWVAIGKRN